MNIHTFLCKTKNNIQKKLLTNLKQLNVFNEIDRTSLGIVEVSQLADIMADMYEQQTDSDEDCEVYFLKPVNEYNIVDKIKEANKELFADGIQGQNDSCNIPEFDSTLNISRTSTSTMTTTTTTTNTTKMTMRKVTFAANLEDYEPESPSKGESENNGDPNGKFSEENITGDAESFSFTAKKSELTKFPTIDEEEQTALEENVANKSESSQLTVGVDPTSDADLNLKSSIEDVDVNDGDDVDDDDDVDEICEEIIVMEMESNTMTNMTTTLSTDTKSDSFSLHHRRAVLKQTTFDCDQEQDNKSLMNLLTASDGEEDDSPRGPQVSIGNNDNYDYDNDDDDDDVNDADSIFNGISDFDDELNTLDDDDDDDDDKLSLIVASYLPDDFECATTISPISPKQQRVSTERNRSYFRRKTTKSCNINSNNNKSPLSLSSSLSFGRRFQLRRKAYSTNSVGTVTTNDAEVNRKPDNQNVLKLNYKTCCEFRNSIQGKLPKYTGYLSEYGLSRDQLEQRQQKAQKKQRFVLEQAIKTNEHDMRKMQDNERAFTTWLRNKMRFPINKTRNMFDVKLKFTSRKKQTSDNDVADNGNNNGKNIGPLDCVAKLRTNS